MKIIEKNLDYYKKWLVSTDMLKGLWRKGLPILINDIEYNIGKMSYGDWFLEPNNGLIRRETDPFDVDTLWLERDSKDKDIYKVAYMTFTIDFHLSL